MLSLPASLDLSSSYYSSSSSSSLPVFSYPWICPEKQLKVVMEGRRWTSGSKRFRFIMFQSFHENRWTNWMLLAGIQRSVLFLLTPRTLNDAGRVQEDLPWHCESECSRLHYGVFRKRNDFADPPTFHEAPPQDPNVKAFSSLFFLANVNALTSQTETVNVVEISCCTSKCGRCHCEHAGRRSFLPSQASNISVMK